MWTCLLHLPDLFLHLCSLCIRARSHLLQVLLEVLVHFLPDVIGRFFKVACHFSVLISAMDVYGVNAQRSVVLERDGERFLSGGERSRCRCFASDRVIRAENPPRFFLLFFVPRNWQDMPALQQ